MIGPGGQPLHDRLARRRTSRWRESHFRDLIGLLGDGLLTIDGDFHRRSRQIMLPAFHRERIAALDRRDARGDRARARRSWRDRARPWTSTRWTRRPGDADRDAGAVRPRPRRRAGARASTPRGLFEQALALLRDANTRSRFLRGPGTPWARMQQAARELDRVIYAEIARRRASGERGEDVLSLLLDAHDEDGSALSDRQIRDEVMTLLFAGHDTTTSTVVVHVLRAGAPPRDRARAASPSRTSACAASRPTAEQLMGGRAAGAGDGAGRDAADVPARLDRPAPLGRAVRVRRPHGPRRRVRELLLVGLAPPARRVPRARALRPRALRPGGRRRRCRRARTSRSAAARGRASGCASASWRCARSRR